MRKITVGLAMAGLLAVLVATAGSSAAATRQVEHGDAAAEPQAQAAKNLVRRFNCSIGRLGEDPCGKRSYGVLAGKYVKIALAGSGGKEIFFKIFSTRTGKELGSVDMDAGDRELIWTNTTRHRVNVRFSADASGTVNTVAQGKFLFGRY